MREEVYMELSGGYQLYKCPQLVFCCCASEQVWTDEVLSRGSSCSTF